MTIRNDTPRVTLLDALRRAPLWSPKALASAAAGDMAATLIGTGPFKFVEWVQNDHITLEKWDGYGGWTAISSEPGPASLGSLTIRFIGEAAVPGQILATGEANMMFGLPPLDEVRVRMAQQFAKDSPAINDILHDGLYQASHGPLSNIHPCYRDGAAAMHPPDPVAAA